MNFNVIKIPNLSAQIVLSCFPGRTKANKFSENEFTSLFDALEDLHCSFLLSLTEDYEFDEYCGKSFFKIATENRSFKWIHIPIVDMNVPDKVFINEYNIVRPKLIKSLSEENCIAIHCKGGLGRSGLVGAMLLSELGFTAKKAINHIRKYRKGAIETQEQEQFIYEFSKSK